MPHHPFPKWRSSASPYLINGISRAFSPPPGAATDAKPWTNHAHAAGVSLPIFMVIMQRTFHPGISGRLTKGKSHV
jgi:hypothetical protein